MISTTFRDALLDIAWDLTASFSTRERYERLVGAVERVVACDAIALLRQEPAGLVPVAVRGLSSEVLGQHFRAGEHPRLDAILASRAPVRFADDDPRPDPYDGLVLGSSDHLCHVHSCLGCALYVGDELVGALTIDALRPGAFLDLGDEDFATFALLAAAAMRTAGLIEALERLAERRGLVAEHLVTSALQRQGGELVGQSAAMGRLREDIALIAPSELPVLVTGETGTGKELVARMLHAGSGRAAEPLVYVNSAALPESIAESELFGHVRGSFTGAHADRTGKFELADGGTLFLDEVGELPLSIQPKLLRVLQEGDVQRVGSDRPLRVDVRVIAATNRDLPEEVRAGRFRADLFHRLSVYPIHVPPLRDRPGDALMLATLFLDRARVHLGLGPARLAPSARTAIGAYAWPGNVRELEHVMQRGALRAAGGRRRQIVVVEAQHLGLDVDPDLPAAAALPAPSPAPSADLPLREATDAFQRELIARTVAAASGSWAEAARRLEVDKGNLHRTAQRLGLK